MRFALPGGDLRQRKHGEERVLEGEVAIEVVVFVNVTLLEGNLLYPAYLGQLELEVIQYPRGSESADFALSPPFSILIISASPPPPPHHLKDSCFSSLFFPATQSSYYL